MKKLLCASMLMIALLLVAAPSAHADTPTPAPTATPTLLPILPTATSPYGGLRATPTALTLITYSMNLNTNSGQLADQAINVYRTFDQNNIIDYILFMLIIGVMALYLVRIISRSTKDE